jgi:methylated-DNA-[protein]-cysteine S-methyltransferase
MTGLDRAAAIVHPGPWGPIQVAATSRGIVGLAFLALPEPFALEVSRTAGVALERARRNSPYEAHLDAARRYLDRLFEGLAPSAAPQLDLRVRSEWDRIVLRGVLEIASGMVAGYGDVARMVGRPGAARAVGGAVSRNPIGLLIPCHRVIAGDGTIGGYGGDWYGSREARLAIKRDLLRLEGVVLQDDPRRAGDGIVAVA